jgi:hypothetical protein
MMEAALAILGVQGVLGAWDNVRNHEFREALPHRMSQGAELALHAAREGFYLVLFPTMAWLEWRGWLAWVLIAIIAAEVVVTCWDFVEEDRTRRLTAEERVLHTVLTLNYGAFLGLFIPVAVSWSTMPAGIGLVDRGAWSWLMTVYSLGVLVFGLRELIAGFRMRRQSRAEAGDPPHLEALGARLPPALRRFHGGCGLRTAVGTAEVQTGGLIARILLRFVGIGLRDGEQALAVTFSPDGTGELWTRQFCTGRFTSRVEAGEPGTLVEFFGPFSFQIALLPLDDGLSWTLRRARFLGVPLPSAIALRIAAQERQSEEGGYYMSAQVAIPLLGLLIAYRATLSRPAAGREP